MSTTHRYSEYQDVCELVVELAQLQKPTKTEVENWLIQYSDIVDMYLENKGYSTPVTTDAKAVQRLKYYVTIKTAAQARLASTRSKNTTSEDPQVKVWNREWEMFLKLIQNGDFSIGNQTSDYGDTTGYMKATRASRE